MIACCQQECALIEQSINSTRVSFRLRTADATEDYLLRTFMRFIVHRWGCLPLPLSQPPAQHFLAIQAMAQLLLYAMAASGPWPAAPMTWTLFAACRCLHTT